MRRYKGQGLIETLIALLIISGGVIATIQFQRNLSYHNSIAQQQAEAAILATSKITELRNFAVINNTSGYNSYQSIASGTSTATGLNASYTLTWTVTTSATTPTYKTVNITASWTDRYGGAQSLTFSSIITGIDPALEASVI